MNPKTKTILLWSGVAFFVAAGIFLLSLSFGGGEEAVPVDLNAISTNAALTVAAQQQTLEAGMATPSPAPSATPLPSPTFQMATPMLLPSANTPAATLATGCDGAVYAADVTIPDGTTIPAGQSFTKTWKVLNNGSCAWTPGYQLVFVEGDSLGGKATPIGLTVNPGAIADVSVVLTSSYAQGTITGKWRLANDKGVAFGDVLTVVINSGATPTPTSPGVAEEPTFEFPTEEAPTEAPTATMEGSSP